MKVALHVRSCPHLRTKPRALQWTPGDLIPVSSHWHQEPLGMKPKTDLLPLTFLSDTGPLNSGAVTASANRTHRNAASSWKVLWESPCYQSLSRSGLYPGGERSAPAPTRPCDCRPQGTTDPQDVSKVRGANHVGSQGGGGEGRWPLTFWPDNFPKRNETKSEHNEGLPLYLAFLCSTRGALRAQLFCEKTGEDLPPHLGPWGRIQTSPVVG